MVDRSYTDDEIRVLVLDADKGFGFATLHTYRRLMRERDDARRVAKSVARDWMTYLLNGTLRDPAPDVDTALAYPEAP